MTPDQIFAELHDAIGGRLFSISMQDAAMGVARRVYSSHPVEFPVSSTQPIAQDRWGLQVLVEGEPFIANTPDELADVVPDHAEIAAMGCGSALNLPVLEGDVVLGTVNVADVEGFFDEIRVFAIQSLIVARHAGLVRALRIRLVEG